MRILAIRGRNLASLAEAFEVDFQAEPLAGAGLFAISGPTGAGKSTLLDALCLALYDDTPRLRSADGRGIELPDVGKETTLPNDRRNILRRGCAEGFAEVDLIGNDGVGYRARWSVRRARAKQDGKLQQTEMSLLRLTDLQPVGSHHKSEVLKAIAERVGLSFEQFTRAVLLAQNEFFTFLKAGEDERAALLQTLTGTDRFELISRRAFERNKAEQEKLRSLRERLADQQPMTADQRDNAERERGTIHTALDGHARRREGLAARLRWHQELAQVRRREDEARAELEQAGARHAAAAERRGLVARVEAVQPARPLVDSGDRLARERDAVSNQRVQAEAAAADTCKAAEAARRHEAEAQAALAAAEAAHAACQPALARARTLDAEIAALAPERAKAAAAQDEATAALRKARDGLGACEAARQETAKRLEAARAWLAGQGDLAPLAESWLRWDAVFSAARQAELDRRQAEGEHARLALLAQDEALALQYARLRHGTSAAQLRERETELKAAAETLGGFDAEHLAQRRGELELSAQALQAAEACGRELADRRSRLDELAAEAKSVDQAITAQRGELDAARARLPIAEGELRQAELAWKTVFEATRADVESLRAGLMPDTPCPVCGAVEHPYAEHHPGLDNALAGLAENLERCRKAVGDLQVDLQAGTTQLTRFEEQLDRIKLRQGGLQSEHAHAASAWDAAFAALAARFPDAGTTDRNDPQAAAAWLAARAAALAAAQQALGEEEARHRRASAALQTAQTALDAARAGHDAAREALTRLEAQVERTAAAIASADKARTTAAERVAAQLDQLDAAAPPCGEQGAAWRDTWAAGPDAYHARCRGLADAWIAQRRTEQTLEQDLARLDGDARGLAQLLAQAEAREGQTRSALHTLEKHLEASRATRREAFAGLALPGGLQAATPDGPGVAEIETAFARAVDTARTALAQRRDTVKAAEARQAREDAILGQLRKQVAEIQDVTARAATELATWLADFNAAAPETAPLDAVALRALLAHDAAWIAGERRALGELDTAVAYARGGLERLSAQREAHEHTRPAADPAEDDTPEALQAALSQVDQTIAALREQLGGVDLALRRDDDIRAKAATLVAAIEAQEGAARVWWQMNELIGAADGKKFRNYAQQLTLDILLGYANAHLRDLARRYRLERVPGSLALMVVDQDMGDEQRSVHSLSGGESFLVSLGLALGLASLSSHRVRVESLFIDEGFGSLDADTLRVAMDALDRLQSLGRKVGVISHVEEMTERIGTRIQVQRLAGGRSRIVVDNAP